MADAAVDVPMEDAAESTEVRLDEDLGAKFRVRNPGWVKLTLPV